MRDDYEFVKIPPPHDNDDWVKIIVKIKNTTTGEIRNYRTETLFTDEDTENPSWWIWESGNYSCDCNRQLFFWRAINEEVKLIPDCSIGKFLVNIYTTKDKLVYQEFKE